MSFLAVMILGGIITAAAFLYCGRRHSTPIRKILILLCLSLGLGYLGSRLMRIIEAGTFQGRSFYGSVLILPLLMPLAARILRVRREDVMDACGIGIAFISCLEKLNCLTNGCCEGRWFRLMVGGFDLSFTFPSQLLESAAGLIIAIALTVVLLQDRTPGAIYPLFLVIYGIARFILNWFRYPTGTILFLPHGCFWSLIAIAWGLLMVRRVIYGGHLLRE